MSAKIMGQVWDLVLSPAERSVLLAMADHADHDGNNVRPSIALIAWKTDYSERQVQRIIGDLRKAGLLIVMQGATPISPTHYRIDIAAGQKKEPFVPARRGRHFVTPMGSQDVTPKEVKQRGDILSPGDIAMSQRGDIAMSPDPSRNHHDHTHDLSGITNTKTKHASRTPPIPKQTNLDSFSEAVSIFKELSGKKQITPTLVTLIVTRVTDMSMWRRTIESWASCGYNVMNIKDMLDWYDHPEKMAAKMGNNNGLGSNQAQSGRMVQRNGHRPSNADLPSGAVSSGQAEYERQYNAWLNSDDENEFTFKRPNMHDL